MTAFERRPGPRMDEHGDWLSRLLEGFTDDVRGLKNEHRETDQLARKNDGRITDLERRMANVESESRATTLSVVEIRAVAKGAGYVSGAITGILGALLTAFLLRVLHIQ